MPLDIKALLAESEGKGFESFRRHGNPQLARVLRTIGFDRTYVRGSGACLWDAEGNKYLDMIGGYGVFGVGLLPSVGPLPPMVLSEEDVAWFLDALEDVMVRLHRFPGPVWDVITRLGKTALAASRATASS